MAHTTNHRIVAVLVAILVACSFAGAPLAAASTATIDDGLDDTFSSDGDDTLSDDDSDSSDGSTEDSSDRTDDSDDDATSGGDDTSGGDETTSDDGDDGDTTDRDSDGDDSNDHVEDRVNETIDSVENTTDTVDDTVDDTVETEPDTETTDDVDETGEIGLTESLEMTTVVLGTAIEGESTETIGEVVTTTEAAVTTVDGTLTAGNDGVVAGVVAGETDGQQAMTLSDEDAEPAVVAGTAGGGGDKPVPAGPAGGVAVGIGAVAAAAALRGTPILAGSAGGIAALGSVAAAPRFALASLVDKLRPFFFPLRYSRYDDSDPLEHEARERVYEIVNEAPGSYLSEVSEEADLPLSTTRHHVRVLEREDLVSGAKLRGKRRFYPAYAEGIELAAALNDDSTASIIDAIARLGSASVSDLASELGRDPSTITHHLQRLEEDDIIAREREGRAVMNKLSAEARTALEPETVPKPGESGGAVAGGAD